MKTDLHRLLLTTLFPSLTVAGADTVPAPDPAPPQNANHCEVDGAALRARLRGAIDADVDWHGDALECEGMPRPAGAGVRVRFRGRLPDGRALAIVFASTELAPGSDREDLPVNVTLIVEDAGRIYGTQGSDRCRLDSVQQREEPGSTGHARRFRVAARGYCTAPAAAIGGGDGVLINRFDFVGRVDVEAKDLAPTHDSDAS